MLASSPAFDDARALVKQLKYNAALPALAKARATPGNDRAALLDILWMQGLVAATLNRKDEARSAFRELLALEPDFKVQGDQPPKVMTPFYEAKNWAVTNGRLSLELDAPTAHAVSARVEHDPLSLARAVRFWVREPGGPWKQQRVAAPFALTFPGDGPHEVWAELLGENDASLVSAQSEERPLRIGVSATPARVEAAPVPVEPQPAVPPPAPPLEAAQPAPRSVSAAQWAGVVAAAIAAGAGGVGAVFGVMSRQGAQQLMDLQMSHMGSAVTELSQADAFALQDRFHQQASAANGLFITAAVCAVVAVVLVIVGRQ